MHTSRLLTTALISLVATATATPTPATAAPAPPPLLQGRIVTQQNPARCLTGGPLGTVLHTAPCVSGNPAQNFYQTSAGHFTNDGRCVQPDGTKARVATCTFRDDQDWWFGTTLRAGEHGRCLTEVGKGTVRLRDCSDKPNRKWRAL